ncbi:hypothetical protein Q8A67_020975 [Cirrhinus molitorella]|uniref:Adrenomedullin n=1 Tax=Cirrhinus molitorella TaxID=172907 RepID=A0AA88P665_9TELE|nr:hypothetical protein Q8A67_020975 [Cirrhinus molitorella]
MVRTKSFLKCLPSMQGHTIMEVAVLLLLTVPMSTTTPVRQTRRAQTENLSLVKSIQRSRDVTLTDIDREIPLVETKTSRKPDLHAASSLLLQTILQKARERRAAQRGCQLGTCQVHNLASKLYQMGQSNGKDESKKANDPTGYGR